METETSQNPTGTMATADATAALPPAIVTRREAMGVFARATIDELHDGLATAGASLVCKDLRAPEIGLIMARGRISGTGQPFNLGEVAVTRAVVRREDGITGFAYLTGRDAQRARLAAMADASWQDESLRPGIEEAILVPVRARLQAERKRRRGEVAATQVDFFTMARGDD